MDFSIDESPAAKALGPLFKLTEIQLWDDGSSEGLSSYVQETAKLVSCDKDCEKDDYGRTNGFCSLPEEVDIELAKQMNDLGLPLSFRTNKETRYGMPSGKKKGSRKSYNQQTPIENDDYIQDSTKGSEEQIKSPASVLNTSEMLDQSDKLESELNSLGESNGINSVVINDSDVAPNKPLSEQTDYKMIETSGEWIAYWDESHMATFFYNVNTYESTWDPPPGMEHLVYSNAADESASMEAHASCDVESVHDLGKEFTNDACSVSQEMDGVSENLLPADNIANTTNKKKKARKARLRKKLSSSSEELWGIPEELPTGVSKYWLKRYMLFSRYDYGIKMDEEGWFSVTPEIIAKHQAMRCGHGVIVDLFAGAGGNSIQFAQRSRHVITVDIDPIKIDYARHNAAIYEVDDRIDFIKSDCFLIAPKLKADAVFMSPPWGGPDYSKQQKFDINFMPKPRDGRSLFDVGKEIAPKIIMFLPKNININQLAELALSAEPPWSLEVEKNYLNGQLKAVTAYFCDPSIS